jgi:shikimate dehydrogenase
MDTYGLVGFPLSQSFSQSFFEQKFKNEKIDAQYLNFSLESIGEFPEIIEDFSIKGLNVTIPYKEKVMPFIHELDDEAKRIGAVNVIKFVKHQGKTLLKGFNSDVYGFEVSLSKYLNSGHTQALILGSGGASKAVRFVLKKLGINFTMVSRKAQKDWLSYSDVSPEIIQRNTLIINTTPLGMYPDIDVCPDLPYELMTAQHLVYDLIYNPEETLFMKKSRQFGAQAVNGSEMLIKQAEKSWEIWNS